MAVNSAIGVTLEQQSAQKKYGEAGVRLFKSFYVGMNLRVARQKMQ